MLTESQINFLDSVCPDNWKYKNDIVDVEGNVDISSMNLTRIPVQFGRVAGNFSCFGNNLTELIGTPTVIKGFFDCGYNYLTTLEGGPHRLKLQGNIHVY